MCQQCVDAVKEHWPNLDAEEAHTLLINCTAFPFGGPDTIAKQVKEMAEKSGCNLGRAVQIALEETDTAMQAAKAAEEKT